MFSKKVINNLLLELTINLLDKCCIIYQPLNNTMSNNYFLFDDSAYAKMCLFDYQKEYLLMILPYYLPSKQQYVLSAMNNITYPIFTTIIRQICNHFKHPYFTKLKYNSSVPLTTYSIQK